MTDHDSSGRFASTLTSTERFWSKVATEVIEMGATRASARITSSR